MKSNLNCVYKITNNINNDIYIGSTKYFSRRKGEHLYKLKNNKHPNKQLQELFNSDNSCLSFVILEIDCTNLKEREQFYLDVLQPKINVCEKADSSLGYKHSKENKDKMSMQRKGKQNSLGRVLSKESKQLMREKALARHAKNKQGFELQRIKESN